MPPSEHETDASDTDIRAVNAKPAATAITIFKPDPSKMATTKQVLKPEYTGPLWKRKLFDAVDQYMEWRRDRSRNLFWEDEDDLEPCLQEAIFELSNPEWKDYRTRQLRTPLPVIQSADELSPHYDWAYEVEFEASQMERRIQTLDITEPETNDNITRNTESPTSSEPWDDFEIIAPPEFEQW